ncbi:glycoside hydrolase family 65 protein [Streptomyces marincola]|uniref:glycoside hydrolase family 65 protein n=1 Tax=Streptomyces marincola TaxID=2878388 RepID=UPI001CF3C00D|nr:glycosyl hydrolase family 65 protein [Streptomyces marincola]UCM87772.1 glycoside hydrolase family 65 protein [Streptomyces marincola]
MTEPASRETTEWTWAYEGYDPRAERLREALCTLGNGYFATRGAAPESVAGPAHYPGTYAAGLYNRLTTTLDGRELEHEDVVNLPNWLAFRFRPHPDEGPDGEWFTPDPVHDPGAEPGPGREPGGHGHGRARLLRYRQVLDLRHGTLGRSVRYRDRHGRHLGVEQCRLVHMADPHLAALRTTFTAEDWSGTIEVESAIDGMAAANTGVERYRDLASHHLTDMGTGSEDPDLVWLRCRTRASDIRVVMAARTRADAEPDRLTPPTRLTDYRAEQRLRLPIRPGRPVTVEKTIALHTSRDTAISSPLGAAVDRLRRAPDFDGLLGTHGAAWERLWRRADLDVPGESGHILRLHLFHLLQTLSPGHTARLDAGVPARGLHGEAYRGHVFWDELFVLPYLNLHFPELSRALMTYRYRRLPAALRAARAAGREGAMFPWQSGSDGREETPETHLNPRSGRWLPDNSRLQHHVGSAVAYNVWRYGQATGDTGFTHAEGAELLLQIARFWASRAEFDPAYERYRIRGVVGPDEYHEAYPDASEPGLDDNAYTNVTAAWVLARALDLARALPAARRRELAERIGLRPEEPELWEDVSRRLRVPFHEGVVSQFDGYGELRELDWEGYRARYGDIRRLDRVLEAEGDTVNRYRASKQADVLMLGYLFSPGELAEVFARLGYAMDDALWRRTVDYYLARTSHGSTLSGVVHAWVLSRVRHGEAWRHLKEALASDVADLQGGTTAEGIHLGAMAGTLDLVQRGLAGLQTREGALWLDPAPVPELSEFGFTVRHRGTAVRVRMKPGQLCVGVPRSEEGPVRVVLADDTVDIAPGEERLLALPREPGRPAPGTAPPGGL